MAFAIALHVIGPYALKQSLQTFARDIFADFRTIFAGVKVEVQAEKTLVTVQARRKKFILFHRLFPGAPCLDIARA